MAGKIKHVIRAFLRTFSKLRLSSGRTGEEAACVGNGKATKISGKGIGKDGFYPEELREEVREEVREADATYEALLNERQQLERRIDTLEREREELEIRRFEAERREAAAMAKLEELTLLLEEKEGRLSTCQDSLQEAGKSQRKLMENVFRFRDQPLIYRDGAEGDVLKFIGMMFRETGAILRKNGVEPVETAEGAFDEGYQTVADTVETEDMGQHMQVSAMFRPGYRKGEELIRREEVIVFVHRDSGV